MLRECCVPPEKYGEAGTPKLPGLCIGEVLLNRFAGGNSGVEANAGPANSLLGLPRYCSLCCCCCCWEAKYCCFALYSLHIWTGVSISASAICAPDSCAGTVVLANKIRLISSTGATLILPKYAPPISGNSGSSASATAKKCASTVNAPCSEMPSCGLNIAGGSQNNHERSF